MHYQIKKAFYEAHIKNMGFDLSSNPELLEELFPKFVDDILNERIPIKNYSQKPEPKIRSIEPCRKGIKKRKTDRKKLAKSVKKRVAESELVARKILRVIMEENIKGIIADMGFDPWWSQEMLSNMTDGNFNPKAPLFLDPQI